MAANEKIAVLEERAKLIAIGRLEKRIARLEARRFILFPFLRAKWLLRKLRFLCGPACCSHCHRVG